MDNLSLQKELCILLCHYLKNSYPSIYRELSAYANEKSLIPGGCSSIEEALELRFSNFPNDFFFHFVQSLKPDDTFSSIFRRIAPFQNERVKFNHLLSQEKTVKAHNDTIYCMVIDPLSRVLITGSDDNKIKIFHIPDFRFVKLLSGHSGVITNLSLNPLCTTLVSSSHDKTIRMWSMTTGKCISILKGFTNNDIHYVVFSPSGSMIAAACEDGSVPIWTTSDALQGKHPCRILRSPARGPVAWVSFSPGGEFISYSSEPSNITVVPMKTMTQTILEFHQSLVDFVQFTKSYYGSGEYGPRLLSVSNKDGTFACWELDSGNWVTKYTIKQAVGKDNNEITKVAVDCNERIVVIGRISRICVYDLLTGDCIGQLPDLPVCDSVICMSCSPTDPDMFFIGNSEGDAAIINVKACRVLSVIHHKKHHICESCWSNDGSCVYASDNDGNIYCFRIVTDKSLVMKKPKELLFCDPNMDVQDEEEEEDEEDDKSKDSSGENTNDDKNEEEDSDDKKEEESSSSESAVIDQSDDIFKEEIDIRDLRLPIKMLQSKFLRNCANELKIIQKMFVLNEQQEEGEQEENRLEIAAVQHIPVTFDIPLNPRGPNATVDADISGDAGAETSVKIQSDSDDWCFGGSNVVIEPPHFSSDNVPNRWPFWMTAVSLDNVSYFPQVGDEVFLFQTLYEPIAIANSFDPLKDDDDSNEQKRGTITFVDQHPAGMILKLSIKSNSVDVIFPLPERVRFMVPVLKYKASLKNLPKLSKAEEIVTITMQSYSSPSIVTAKVINIRDDAKSNPVNSITISTAETSKTMTISPWDVFSINGEEIRCDYQLKIHREMLIGVIDSLLANKDFKAFRKLSSIKLELLSRIAHPMSLTLLAERINSNYYRTPKGVIDDINKFNELYSDDPVLAKKAEDMVKILRNSM